LHLGRDKNLVLFGPCGLIENVEGKLRGYSWNLVENYPYDFRIYVYEFGENPGHAAWFACREAFRKHALVSPNGFESPAILLDEPSFRIRSVLLEHDIPCLCFRLEEKGHINIDKVRLEQRGFHVGPWIKQLKDAVRNEEDEDAMIQVLSDAEEGKRFKAVPLKVLKEEILRITRGQKIVYVSDAAFTQGNIERIVKIAHKADIMFCEAAFSEQDRERAQARRHLTAHQAGYLARMAGVDRLILFHFSPQYHGKVELLYSEASQAFGKAVS
jgi:ribonuclease Z